MSRSRASARAAGSRFERLCADYLNEHVSEFIDRRPRMGAADCGDIANVRFVRVTNGLYGYSGRVTVECKDTARPALGTWLAEVEAERINDAGDAGVIFHKRHGKAAAGDQLVTMTLRDYVTHLTGRRPDA